MLNLWHVFVFAAGAAALLAIANPERESPVRVDPGNEDPPDAKGQQ